MYYYNYFSDDEQNEREDRETQETSTGRGKRKKFNRLDLVNLTDKQCKQIFRFTLEEIRRICSALKLESTLDFKGVKVENTLAIAMLLHNHSFPRRLIDMEFFFGMAEKNISRTLNRISEIIMKKLEYGLQFDERQFSKENCERFASAIFEKGAFFPHTVGFIDSTMQQTCRPTGEAIQESMYNGWKHMRCNNFQAIFTPDGMISSVCGAYVGRRNDMGMLSESKTHERLKRHFETISPNKTYAIYGDEEYSLSRHLICPNRQPFNTGHEKETNESMSNVRAAIETPQYFGSCKWKYGNKSGKTTPARKYVIAILFENFYTCINGSATSSVFNLSPPTLEEYVEGLMRPRSANDVGEC